MASEKKQYLVTGGAGFIGTNLVIQLLEAGHQVRVIDNYAGGKKPERLQEGVEYLEGDIRSMDDLNQAMAGIDGVFHLAALPRVTYSVEHPQETHDVNVNGTLNVLLAARDNHVRRVVFSSSSSTYGNQETYPLVEDAMVKKPIAPYALHKFIGEEYCRLFFELYGLQTVSLIYFNVYGPFCDPNGAYALVIGKFLQQVRNGEPMSVCGDGEYYRDYTHVSDVASGVITVALHPKAENKDFNIGSDKEIKMIDLAKKIWQL